MIILPNGCTCSNLSVFPKSWKTPKASIKIKWYISYRFYDPNFRNKYPYGKQIQIKGMNLYKELTPRREATITLIEEELYQLKTNGVNPITGKKNEEIERFYEILPSTPFIEALYQVFKTLKYDKTTLSDLKGILKGVNLAATELRINNIPVSEIRRRHIKMILEYCPEIIKGWSAKRFNRYRAYLSILFKELVELETIESNPIREISKQKITKVAREILNVEERKKINTFLKEHYYEFWRFIQIFFHSGSRESELLLMKIVDIDLAQQKFKVIVEKGKQNIEQWRPIKTIILPLWKEIVVNASSFQYVFSTGLKPGLNAINPAQLTRRWREHVKIKLNIKADLYSLKHLNLDETAEALSIEDASKMAAHSSIETTKIYTVNQGKRQDERLKRLENHFA